MNPGQADERTLVEYLLGRLPEAERARTEERIFTDEGLEEELLATADELIHAYLSGSLPDEDRLRFETHFLAQPRHQQRLAFIKDLGQAVARITAQNPDRNARPKAPWAWKRLWPATAAAAVIVVAVLVVFQRSVEAPGGTVTRSDRPATPAPVPAVVPQQSPTGVAPQPTIPQASTRTVRLPLESGSLVRVPVAQGIRSVRVEVVVPEGPPSFDVILRAPDGKEVWRTESLAPPPSGKWLAFSVPAESLQEAVYRLRVEGEPLRDTAAPVIEYRIQVVRER